MANDRRPPVRRRGTNENRGNKLETQFGDSNKITEETEIHETHSAVATGGGFKSAHKNRLECRSRVTSRRANELFLLLRIKGSVGRAAWSLFFLALIGCANGYRDQKFAIEPQDQSAVFGSRVTLPCRVVRKAGHLQWTKDDFGLGTHRNLSGYERYEMIGSDDEGDYSLDIRDVVLEDDGLYQCQVSSGPRGEPAIRSRYARLIVLAPPEPPKILQGSVLHAVEDREISLECVSIGGKPAAEITWVDDNGGVLVNGVNNNVELMADGRRFTARSTLRLRPRRYHQNQTFTCQAQNTADRAYRTAAIQLKVKYAPKVKVYMTRDSTRDRIAEGDNVTIGCDADANPNDVTFKWFVNNEQIAGNFAKKLVLFNISRSYNEASVKCEAHNSIGKSSETKTLEVTYGPKFTVKPQNVETEVGSVTVLSCVVDGHPEPSILWLHYDLDRVTRVGKSSNLSITVNHRSAGLYWCRASVAGFPDIEAQATVYIKGPPKITSKKTQYGVEGDRVSVECTSFSIPKPDYVLWTFGGHEINLAYNQDYAFLEETLPEGITKSTLIIRESVLRHFGRYNCSVANIYGTDSVEIHLMPDKSFPLILIIAAGASAASLVAVVLLLIILCHRRRRKHSSSEDIKKPDVTDTGKAGFDPFKDSDRNSNMSDMKIELRQVEGSCDMDNSNGDTEYLHPNIHLTPILGLGLPLAGPVSLPAMGYDNELIKQYQRYSSDFTVPVNNSHHKVHNQSNGYVPYVDYNRDYIPPVLPSTDSLNGSTSRSVDTSSTIQCGSRVSQNGSLQRLGQKHGSCNALHSLGAQNIGPDVIPMTNPGTISAGGVDVRYAATYGNPYLRTTNGPISQVNTANPAATPAPPPYYLYRTSNLHPVTSITSPSSSSSSRPTTSPMASSSSTTSGAQPQVPKISPQGPASLYILPPHSRGSHIKQITTKGIGVPASTGTHV